MTLKTLAFYNDAFPFGGAESVTRHLGRFFHEKGIRILVYTRLNNPDLHYPEESFISVHEIPVTERLESPENIDYLCHSLREEEVDIVIIQSAVRFPTEAIKKSCSCRLIFCLHSMPLWEPIGMRSIRSWDIKNPTFLRRMEYILLRQPRNYLTNRLQKRYLDYYGKLLRHIDRFVSLCPSYAQEMERLLVENNYLHPSETAGKFAVICNPLLPIEAPVEEKREKIVLFLARFTYMDKRPDRMLKIWKKVEERDPDWRLLLVGAGYYENKMRQLVQKWRLKRVEFVGYQSDVTDYYRRATFCCLTSNFEGLPMCFLEGQQYGVIPVSFDSYDGFRYISDEGRAGIAVPAFSLKKYAEQLGAAMEDATLQKRMQKAAIKAAHRYDLDRIGNEWLSLFAELTDRPDAP